MSVKVSNSLVQTIKDGYTLTISEVVEILHYQPLHIRKLCREGKLDSIKVRGMWLVKESSCKKYEGKKSSKVLTEENQSLLQLIKELEGKIEQLKTK